MNDALDKLAEFAEQKRLFWLNPTRGHCGRKECPDEDAILWEAADGVMVCGFHYRQQSNRDRPYPCDECGREGAFRDPAHRRDEYKCHECHAKDGYVPGDRSMITKIAARVGAVHSQGKRDPCVAAGYSTECKGQVKPRGKLGVLCDFHADPKKYLKRKGP